MLPAPNSFCLLPAHICTAQHCNYSPAGTVASRCRAHRTKTRAMVT